MKYLYRYTIMVFLMFFIISNGAMISATETGFSTEIMSEKDRDIFLSNFDIALLEKTPVQKTIQCFDVNEKGMIAVVQNGEKGKEVCIYSSQGLFQYGYTFGAEQSVGVEWDAENINIYFVRSDVLVSVNPEGTILDILAVPDTRENNHHHNHLLHTTQRSIGETKYELRNDMGILNYVAASYSQLVLTNSKGEMSVIYDVNSMQLAKIITACVLAILLFLLVITIVLKRDKNVIQRTHLSPD